MRPPMPKLDDGVLTLQQPKLDDSGNPLKDDHGRPITGQVPIKQARIRQSTKLIQSSDGQSNQCVLEIDFPPEIAISVSDGAEYHPPNAAPITGKILSISESVNLAGNRVYFRTAYVG